LHDPEWCWLGERDAIGQSLGRRFFTKPAHVEAPEGFDLFPNFIRPGDLV
jgi:hypothetical protein